MAAPSQLDGSFRGVPFGLFSHSMEGGRRTATHEFPGRNDPYTEDLGRKARTFQLDMFVLGDDVYAQRDALRAALEAKGPGTLVHPWLGTLSVQVSGFTLSEANDAQRQASFSVTFIQPGKLEFPTAATNPSGTVSSSSTNASLQAGYTAGTIDVAAPAAAQAMTTLVTSVSSAVTTAAQAAAQPNSLAAASDTSTAIAAMSQYQSDSNALAGMVATPDLMSYATADVIFRLASLGMTALQAFYAYQRLLGSAQAIFAALRFPSTAAGAVMASNAALYQNAVLTAIVGSAAANAVDAAFTTQDQAVAAREALAGMFDVVMGIVLDDTLFGYLQDLRASSLTAIPDPNQSLPNVVSVSVPAPRPSLCLAHDLMSGSVDEQTIIDLNGVQNPWFVPNTAGAPVLILR